MMRIYWSDCASPATPGGFVRGAPERFDLHSFPHVGADHARFWREYTSLLSLVHAPSCTQTPHLLESGSCSFRDVVKSRLPPRAQAALRLALLQAEPSTICRSAAPTASWLHLSQEPYHPRADAETR